MSHGEVKVHVSPMQLPFGSSGRVLTRCQGVATQVIDAEVQSNRIAVSRSVVRQSNCYLAEAVATSPHNPSLGIQAEVLGTSGITSP